MINYKIKTILVPVDFTEASETALSKAVAMSKLLKAGVLLLHVISSEGSSSTDVQLELTANEKLKEIQNDVSRKLKITPEIFLRTGQIEKEIINFSRSKTIDLIIMGARADSGYKEQLVGSTSQHIITHSEAPVLTLRKSKSESRFRNILIPIDNSLHSREKVNIAVKIAQICKAKVHILGLIDTINEKQIAEFKIKMDSIEKIVSNEKIAFQASVVKDGSIAKTAIMYAENNKCDLIVINAGHESEITGIFLGVFAQQIVDNCDIPVLSVKPKHGSYGAVELTGSINPFLELS